MATPLISPKAAKVYWTAAISCSARIDPAFVYRVRSVVHAGGLQLSGLVNMLQSAALPPPLILLLDYNWRKSVDYQPWRFKSLFGRAD